MFGIKISSNCKKVGCVISFSTTYNNDHITNIIWNFGDGSKSNKNSPNHVYKTTGIKNIRCTINNRYKLKSKITISDKTSPTLVQTPDPDPDPDGFKIINNSADSNIRVTLFQQNIVASVGIEPVAWKVILLEGSGASYNLVFEDDLQIEASDSLGNFTPRLSAEPGQLFTYQTSMSGNTLNLTGSSSDPGEIDLVNSTSGVITGLIYRNGDRLSIIENIDNAGTVMFQFNTTIFIGVVEGTSQGELINSSLVSQFNTQIYLLGIKSSDIVITGGGSGPSSTPYSFSLSNVVLL